MDCCRLPVHNADTFVTNQHVHHKQIINELGNGLEFRKEYQNSLNASTKNLIQQGTVLLFRVFQSITLSFLTPCRKERQKGFLFKSKAYKLLFERLTALRENDFAGSGLPGSGYTPERTCEISIYPARQARSSDDIFVVGKGLGRHPEIEDLPLTVQFDQDEPHLR